MFSLFNHSRLMTVCALLVSFLCAQFSLASEEPSQLAKRFQSADLVARIKIDKVRNFVVPGHSSGGLISVLGQEYSSSFLKSWKGTRGTTLSFMIYFDDCIHSLKSKQEYLLFLQRGEGSFLRFVSCDQAISLESISASTLLALETELDHLGSIAASPSNDES